MKNLTWDEYYENFYDWSLSTQKSYFYRLTSFGDADEVFEVVSEFAFYDKGFATRFVDKALSCGVQFTPDHVLELTLVIEKPTLSRMAETAKPAFNRDQLEEIYLLIDDDSFKRISHKQKIDIFEDDIKDDELDEELDWIEPTPETPKSKLGFFGTLFAVIAGSATLTKPSPRKHNGRCNGDCANCPPHYGYRYGRWYYGHDHVHGCEFGGNKGSGSID